MKIVLINPYGPLSTEGWKTYRFETFCQILAEAGHDAIWLTSRFSHHFKCYRNSSVVQIDRANSKKYSIELLHSLKYKHNMSLMRVVRDLFFEIHVVFRLISLHRKLGSIDIVFYYGSPFSLYLSILLTKRFLGYKLVYDQIDLWPELQKDSMIRYLGKFCGTYLHDLFARYRDTTVSSLADRIIGLSTLYANSIPLTCQPTPAIIYNASKQEAGNIDSKYILRQISPVLDKFISRGKRILVYTGSLGPNYDIRTLLDGFLLASLNNSSTCLVIAGSGSKAKLVSNYMRDYPEKILYLEPLEYPTALELIRISEIGFLPYMPYSNVEIPDKFMDYVGCGVPIISSLSGESRDLINKFKVGSFYEAGIPASLASAIVNILSLTVDQRKDMSKSLFELSKRFSFSSQKTNLLEVVESLSQPFSLSHSSKS